MKVYLILLISLLIAFSCAPKSRYAHKTVTYAEYSYQARDLFWQKLIWECHILILVPNAPTIDYILSTPDNRPFCTRDVDNANKIKCEAEYNCWEKKQ